MTTHEDGVSPLVRAAQRLVGRLEAMEQEVERLRSDNAALRADVREAVALFSRVRGRPDAADGARPQRAAKQTTRRRRRKPVKGRATPAEVTPDIVRAVIVKLGPATAAEIAKEITSHGPHVSGRAVRFLAERAGAQPVLGDDGQRRYRLG